MTNPHIIVGDNRRCLCGMYGEAEARQPVSCADILAKPETASMVLNSLARECDDSAAAEGAVPVPIQRPEGHPANPVRGRDGDPTKIRDRFA